MREKDLQKDVEKAVMTIPDVLLYDTSHVGRVREMGGRVIDLNQMTGQSDLLILVASNRGPIAYAIELKTKKGRQSKAQEKWQAKVWEKRFGLGHYCVCRSVEEVMDAIGKSREWREHKGSYSKKAGKVVEGRDKVVEGPTRKVRGKGKRE
tara:strand:- start:2452 stop:2904 length:453 start_codon:yes stop_codon:yes gene_type:complete